MALAAGEIAHGRTDLKAYDRAFLDPLAITYAHAIPAGQCRPGCQYHSGERETECGGCPGIHRLIMRPEQGLGKFAVLRTLGRVDG